MPLAAALFKGGLSFDGTVAFVFADLIALPLVIIYGKFYGRRIALRILFSFWAVMSVSDLVVDLLFRTVGIPAPGRPAEIAHASLEWNYTTWLNGIALIVAAVVYGLYRNRERFGGMGAYAKDLVCGMQVERAHVPATDVHDGTTYYFCSDRCHAKFIAAPAKYIHQPGTEPMTPVTGNGSGQPGGTGDTGMAADPVCGMDVTVAAPAATSVQCPGRGYVLFLLPRLP